MGIGGGFSTYQIIPIYLSYQFNYKCLTAKEKFNFFPFSIINGENEVISNDIFVGIKTKENKPVIVSLNGGLSMFQFQPIGNVNLTFPINKHHRITTDFFVSRYTVQLSSYTKPLYYSTSTYFSVEVGYSYRFIRKEKTQALEIN